MSISGPAIRVEQWTGNQLPAKDSSCIITTRPTTGKPSLLDTLKAAAHEAALQAAAERKADEAVPSAVPSGILLSPDMCPRPAPVAQELGESQKVAMQSAAATQINARAGGPKLSLQPILLKRSISRGQKGCTGPDSPASPASATALGSVTTRFVHKARYELAKLEMDIPWEAVHKTWKLHRSQWRKTLKQAESVLDITDATRELRNALSIPGSPFSHYGGSWDQLQQHCCSGSATLDDLGQLLNELKVNAKAWVKVKDQEVHELGEDKKALAMRGLEALCQAAQLGPAAVAQCPLEAILDYDEDALCALRELIEREINLQSTASAMGGEEVGKCPAGSVFASVLESRMSEQGLNSRRILGVSSSGETASESLLAT